MKKLVYILILMSLSSWVHAQDKLVFGYILEAHNAGVIPEGATLFLKDSTGITEPIQKKSNKHNGYFELLVADRFETLIISKNGYETREVQLNYFNGFIPRDSLSLTRSINLDLRAYPNSQSSSFISSGLDIRRMITQEDGVVQTTQLFGLDDPIQSVHLTRSNAPADSLIIESEVYETRAIAIGDLFDDLTAAERMNYILTDTLKSIEKLFFQRGISTAGKRNQSIGQIPASVVIVSKEEILAQGYQSLPEILENVTGLYLFRDYSWSGGDPIVGMRGFFSQGFNNDIIILVNGVNMYEEYWGYYPFSRFPIAVEAIDRIEIVRGPMSVLYGSGAFFGAINIITNSPLETDVADNETFPKYLALSYGSRDTRRVSGGLKYKKDRISFAFNTNVTATDGLDQPFGRFLGEATSLKVDSAVNANPEIRSRTNEMLPREQRYLSASLSLQDKAGLTQYSVDLTASSENRGVFESTVASSNSFCACPIPESYTQSPGVLNRSNSIYGGVRITHSPKDNNLNLNASLFFHEYRTQIDYDAGGNRIGQSTFLSKAFETELSASKSWRKISGIVGFNTRIADDLFTTFDTPNANLTDGNNFIRLDDNQNLALISAFGEFEYEMLPNKLAFTGGLRIEKLSDFNYLSKPTSQTNLAITPDRSDDIQADAVVIPRGALVWTLNPTNFLKILYGEARKRPSFGNFTDTTSLQFPRIQTIEVNYIRESEIKEDQKLRTRFNASFYYNSIENLLSRVSSVDASGDATFFSGNTRSVNTIGGEAGLFLSHTDNWQIEMSGSLNRSNETQIFKNDTVTNQSPSFSPWLLAYFKANYHWKLKPFDLSAGLNMRYISQVQSGLIVVEGNVQRLGDQIRDYTQSNLNLRISRSSLTPDQQRNKLRNMYLALSMTNVLNANVQYPTTGNNESWATQGSPGFSRRFFLTLGFDI